jgi:hypothetical protein
MTRMKFDALVRAHGFMKTERPPELWEADTEDVRVIPLLGEMIAAALVGGAPLEELTLNVSNVVVPADDDPRGAGPCAGGDLHAPPAGEFVALTVRGQTDLGPDHAWRPAHAPQAGLLLGGLDGRLAGAGAHYAYVRRMPPEGSVTVFLRRLHLADPT